MAVYNGFKINSDWYKKFNSKIQFELFVTNLLKGIANSLDFTDRILPRLELKPECKPKIVNFTPYSKEDIINIIKDRLQMVGKDKNNCVIIEDKALNLCATKIASSNGDIRKVLDICRFIIK